MTFLFHLFMKNPSVVARHTSECLAILPDAFTARGSSTSPAQPTVDVHSELFCDESMAAWAMHASRESSDAYLTYVVFSIFHFHLFGIMSLRFRCHCSNCFKKRLFFVFSVFYTERKFLIKEQCRNDPIISSDNDRPMIKKAKGVNSTEDNPKAATKSNM